MSLPLAILVDLDGTLTNVDHRVHHVQDREKPDWKSFSDKMVDDPLNHWCLSLIQAMQAKNHKVIFVTGRGEEYREQTLNWLAQHSIEFEALYMRPKADKREDFEIKKEIYLEHIKESFEVVFIVEDRLSVVRMWRELGLICLHCDWGDF